MNPELTEEEFDKFEEIIGILRYNHVYTEEADKILVKGIETLRSIVKDESNWDSIKKDFEY